MSVFEFTQIQDSFVHYNEIIELYSELTSAPSISSTDYSFFLASLYPNEKVYVMTDENSKLVGLGSILIEQKLIHGVSKVGHIEDIVISSKYRGKGCGKQLIDFLVNIGQEEGCYKIILDCKPELENFYKKSGFSYKNIQMSKYFD